MNICFCIEKLLFDHECVIVPGLGGFIANERPTVHHPLTHQFRPPFKKLIFNPHIRFNDGLLINFIVKQEQITFETAHLKVEEFVSETINKLENRERVHLKNIGFLLFDENKNFIFDQDTSINYQTESFGLENIVSPAVKRVIREVIPEEIITRKEPVSNRIDRKPAISVSEDLKPRHERKSVRKQKNLKVVLLISAAFILLSASVWFYFEKENALPYWQTFSASFMKDNLERHYSPRLSSNTKQLGIETNQAGFLSETDFISESLNGNAAEESAEKIESAVNISKKYIFVYPLVDQKIEQSTENESSEDLSKEVEPESLAAEIIEPAITEIAASAPDKNTLTKVNIQPTGPYFIIAGAFKDEKNARNLIEALLIKGFPAQIIDTNRNGMYRVAYTGFQTLNEAKQQLFAIREEDNPEAWILKK